MEHVTKLKRHLDGNNLEEIWKIELSCLKLLSETIKLYDGARDKICRDNFAQCIITDEIKRKIVTSDDQMVIAGRYVLIFFLVKFSF